MFVVSMMGTAIEGSVALQLGGALLQASIAIAVVIFGGRWLLRPLFRRVALTKSPELFMAACLLVILVMSLVTAIAGLSMALGALMAGLLLAETEYRRQIEFTIEPFKGLLVGVFLISAGMNVDLRRVVLEPASILLASTALIAVKTLVVAGAGRLHNVSWVSGVRAGLLLGPGSEFTFVIISLALASNAIPAEAGAFTLIVAALTMAMIPALHSAGRLFERMRRVGRVVAELLAKHGIPYLAVDSNAEAVAKARDQGFPVYFGDIKQPDFMRLCGIRAASALVLTMDSPKSANLVVQMARGEREDLIVIARARDARHAGELYRLGATDAVPETIEASLQLAEVVLVDVGVAMGPAIASIHEKRSEMRDQIQAQSPEAEVRHRPRKRLRDALSDATRRDQSR
jgi:CPA2 family monovalent cation:H+ antiporter-2